MEILEISAINHYLYIISLVEVTREVLQAKYTFHNVFNGASANNSVSLPVKVQSQIQAQ